MEKNTVRNKNSDGGNYWVWAFLTGVIIFLGIWIYAITEWGLLFGLLFGWLPALIGGFVAGILWPIVAIIVAIIIVIILLNW